VPKSKIYAHGRPTKRVKDLFVMEVEEILWRYKLSPETVNLPARDGINEIQVFEILLKGPELDSAVLECIERAVPFPLLFQLTYEDHTSFAACYKRPNDADPSKWVIEACFRTEPQALNAERVPLPVALDLASLHEQLLRWHIALPARPGEGIHEQVARFNAIAAKEKEQQQLKIRLKHEKQFNRKIELNAVLRSITQELQNLQKF
jgi:hypothetical protein